MQGLKINTRSLAGGKTVAVDIAGELDMSSSPDLRRVLVGLVDGKTQRIVLNLTEVGYIDSSGLATFVECFRNVKRYQGSLRLYGINEQISDIFKLAHLDTFFEIKADEAGALAE